MNISDPQIFRVANREVSACVFKYGVADVRVMDPVKGWTVNPDWIDLHWVEFHEKLPRELRQILPWGQDTDSEWRGAYVFDDNIQCPYCAEEDDEHGEYPCALQQDGDTALTECGDCGKTFRVVLSVTYEFASEPLEKKEG